MRHQLCIGELRYEKAFLTGSMLPVKTGSLLPVLPYRRKCRRIRSSIHRGVCSRLQFRLSALGASREGKQDARSS